LFGPGPARLAEGGAEGFGIGHDGVAGKVQRLTGPLRRIGMAGAAGIFDHHRNDAEIGGVARGRRDADLHRDARHGERANPFTRGISQFGNPVIPGWSAGPDPESRDSGFTAARRPGMTLNIGEPRNDASSLVS
jgi:hypothetical protein